MRNAAQEQLALFVPHPDPGLRPGGSRLAMMVELRLERVDLRGIEAGRCSQGATKRSMASRSVKVSTPYTLAELTTLLESIV